MISDNDGDEENDFNIRKQQKRQLLRKKQKQKDIKPRQKNLKRQIKFELDDLDNDFDGNEYNDVRKDLDNKVDRNTNIRNNRNMLRKKFKYS